VVVATAVTLGFGLRADLLLDPLEAAATEMVPSITEGSSRYISTEEGTPEDRQRQAAERESSLDKSRLSGAGGGGARPRGDGDVRRPPPD
jgi:hypothetical protein